MIRENYNGYLKPHLGRIKALHAAGSSPLDIAKILRAEGARSPWEDDYSIDNETSMAGIVRHILGLRKKKPNIDKLKHRVKYFKQQLRDAERALAKAQRER